MAAARCSTEVNVEDVRNAHTVLSHAEHVMPKALGEFGRGKHSATQHTIIEYISRQIKPVTLIELITLVNSDLNNPSELAPILQGLEKAGKIQRVNEGWLLAHKRVIIMDNEFYNPDFLTEEERLI